MSSLGKNKKERSIPKFLEKDVLGLDKAEKKLTESTGRPDIIFIVVAILVIVITLYWLISNY